MKTRILHTKLWKDAFFSELSPTEKLIFMYFLTNEDMNILHIYECPDKKVMFDTGVTSTQLEASKLKFSQEGKIHFYKGYVYVKNADKYEDYSGDRYDKAKETLKKQIGEDVINHFLTSQELVKEEFDTTSKVDIIHKSKIINHKPETSRNYLKTFPIEDFSDIDATEKQIRLEAEKADNWLEAEGKRKKDYKAFLRNWVLKAYKKRAGTISTQADRYEVDESGMARLKELKNNNPLKGMQSLNSTIDN